MKYHKKLTREDVARQGWNKILLMIASELSRAGHLSKNGGGKEEKMCVSRAKELIGVLESEPSLPSKIALTLLKTLDNFSQPSKNKYEYLYNNFMTLAS